MRQFLFYPNRKMLLRAAAAALVISVLMTLIPFQNSCEELYTDVFRIHIIPNSDSASDQSLKLCVRDAILSEISPCYRNAQKKEDAMAITKDNLDRILMSAQRTVRLSGSSQTVRAEIKNCYFNTRLYDGFTMPAGYYDALEVTLGEGRGQNFWCVMYPTLCVGAATREKLREDLDDGEYRVVTSDDIEFRFKIVECFEQVRAWFR